MSASENRIAMRLKHDGVRVGEIIAYRAWRVIHPWWFRSGDDRLHSVLMKDYVWHPDQPACGDVQRHGIYSFRDVIRSNEEYWYSVGRASLLFGQVKIWGEGRGARSGLPLPVRKSRQSGLWRSRASREVPQDL